jgi:hypothetical protein
VVDVVKDTQSIIEKKLYSVEAVFSFKVVNKNKLNQEGKLNEFNRAALEYALIYDSYSKHKFNLVLKPKTIKTNSQSS